MSACFLLLSHRRRMSTIVYYHFLHFLTVKGLYDAIGVQEISDGEVDAVSV